MSLSRVKVWTENPSSPELATFHTAPWGDPVADPDGIATNGAPYVDIVISPVSGIDKFELIGWGAGSDAWEVIGGEVFTQNDAINSSRYRLRRTVGSGIRYVAIRAYDVIGGSFDGTDDTIIYLDATYGG